MAHGTFGMVATPTDNGGDSAGNYNDSAFASRNVVSHTLVAGLNGSYQLTNCLSLFGQADYISISNYKNKHGDKAGDVQLTLGAMYRI